MSRLEEIRQAEAQSHTAAYETYTLYAPGTWLSRPVKALTELLPLYAEQRGLKILDLGSGVGRNAIAVALALPQSRVTCVDILPLAIEKLLENAAQFGISEQITGISGSVDGFEIEENGYDIILAGSVLEHLDSKDSAAKKLSEIAKGIRPGGAVMIVMNTGVMEWDKQTMEAREPQFEVNLPTGEARGLLDVYFRGWKILTERLSHQNYDVPRGERTVTISSEVVTFAARRNG